MTKKTKKQKEPPLRESTWGEFYNTGLLMFVNTFLHIFGWALVYDCDDDANIIRVYPARTSFRGFDRGITENSYIKLTQYMTENAEHLLKEVSRK
jgi:hypothetical protein